MSILSKISILLFFVFVSLIYTHNITRDIYSGDIGDLVTSSYVLGVAHPPGYPLFTLLGFIFSHLPISLPVVGRVGLISVISSVIALFIFYKFAMNITKSLFLSLLSTSILAFSYLFWLHAEIPEVFGLHNLFVIGILYLAIIFCQTKKIQYLYLLSFFSGLSMTHHHTILFIFPGVLVLILKHFKYLFTHKKKVFYGSLFFVLGLVPYVYVPLAARLNPVINWDQASNLTNFIHLILRQDYGFAPSLLAAPVPIKLILVKDYFKTLIDLYSYQVFFLSILGVAWLFKKDKWLFSGVLVAFLLSGPFFIFYAASAVATETAWGIIERFYTFSSVIFMFFIPPGLVFIRNFLSLRLPKKIYTYPFLIYFLIIPLYLLYYNFPKTDLSKTQIGNNLASDILSSVDYNGILFLSGDTTVFNTWYVYYVQNIRGDIDIINPAGVGGNIYLDDEINKYHNNNPKVKLHEVLGKTLDEIRKKRQIFATYDMEYKPKGTLLLPKGLVFELIDDKDIPTEKDYLQEVENNLKKIKRVRRETLLPSERNLITPEIPTIYSNSLVRIADFLDSHYRSHQKAEHYYRRALWIDDKNPTAYAGLGLSLYKAYKDCDQSINNLKEAIDLYPVWKKYYLQLYIIYDKCKVSKKIIDEHNALYKREFGETIEQAIKTANLKI